MSGPVRAIARPASGAADPLASDVAAPEAVPAAGIPQDGTGSGAASAPATAPEAVLTVANLLELRGPAYQAAWHHYPSAGVAAVSLAVRLVAASPCVCCGRRWGLRALAARLDREIPRQSGRPRYGGGLAHSTLSRIARHSTSYGQRVDVWTYREVGKALVQALGTET